jgi:hypothetical protein
MTDRLMATEKAMRCPNPMGIEFEYSDTGMPMGLTDPERKT